MSISERAIPAEPGRRRRSRFGPSAIVRDAPASEARELLSLFPREEDTVRPERRRSPRFAAVETSAWLGWWAVPDAFVTLAARLVDISQGGAKLVVIEPVPPGPEQIVWLCLGIPEPTECVQAKVLEVTPFPHGQSVVRLAFGTPCPENLYRIAISGLPPAERDAR